MPENPDACAHEWTRIEEPEKKFKLVVIADDGSHIEDPTDIVRYPELECLKCGAVLMRRFGDSV